jgi:hypothetical protein
VRVLQADDQETLFITHVAGTDLELARRVHVTSAQEGDGDIDDEGEGEGEDLAETTDAGSEFDGEAEADSTLVEPAPAGAADVELQERGEE